MRRLAQILIFAILLMLVWAPHLATAQSARPVGSEFIINTTTAGNQRQPDVAMRGNRQFIVVWSGPVPDQGLDIRGRGFNWDGTPRGSEFAVNSATANDQKNPQVAMDSMGEFTVVWVDRDTSGSGGDIEARAFGLADTPVAPDVLVRDTGPETSLLRARHPSVVASGNGRFVVAWREESPGQAMGRIVDVAGSSLESVFMVGSFGTGYYAEGAAGGSTDLASDSAGNFVVVYDDPYYCSCAGGGGNLGNAHRRSFDPAGQPTSSLESVVFPTAFPPPHKPSHATGRGR